MALQHHRWRCCTQLTDRGAVRRHLQLQQNYYWLSLGGKYFHTPPQLYIEQLIQGGVSQHP